MAKMREIYTREVVSAAPDTTALKAALLMRRHHVGSVDVCDDLGDLARIAAGAREAAARK